MTPRRIVLTLALTTLLGTVPCPAEDAAPTQQPRPPRLNPDQPDAAAEYMAFKRRPVDPGAEDTASLYQAAREHAEGMPVHATRLGITVPSQWRAIAKAGGTIEVLLNLGRWSSLGPGNIGGRTRTLVIHPGNPDVMYSGGVSGGLWKTTDGGQSWRPLADWLSNIAVNALVMHPDDPDVVWAGTGEGYFREEVRGTWLPLRGEGIYWTADGGDTWSRLPSTEGEDFHWVNDIAFSRHNPDRVYAATRSGVWRSDDAGDTWTRTLDPAVKGGCLDLALRTDQPGDWLFASCGTLAQATVYRNRAAEAGSDWEAVLSDPGMGRTYLAVAPSDQRVIYALAATNEGGPGGHYEQGLHAVFRSDSAGEAGTWSVQVRNTNPIKLNTLLLTNPAAASYADCGWYPSNSWINMGWYCNVIAVDPMDPDTVWAAGVDLFRSDDGGRNWGLASYWWTNPLDETFVHADQHVIVFHPAYDGSSNRTMFVGNDGGIFRTDDARAAVAYGQQAICNPYMPGTSFVALNHDFGITQFYHGVPFPDGTRYIGGTQDNGTLLGLDQVGANGWMHVWGGDGGYCAVNPEDPSEVYAESQNFGFVKSTNGGFSYQSSDAGINDMDFLFVTPFTMDRNQPQRLWTGGRRIWRTDNGAALWRAASTMLPGYDQVSALAVAPGDSNLVLVGGSEGRIYRHQSALGSSSSTSWEWVQPRQGFVSWLAFDPTATDVVYATFAGFGGDHVYRSADSGLSWTSIDGEGASRLPDIPVHCIVVDPTRPERLFLGTDLGVFTSTTGGGAWAVENTGFANVVTESLSLSMVPERRPQLYAFTHGRGAWRVGLVPEAAHRDTE